MSTSASAPAADPGRVGPLRNWGHSLLQLATRRRMAVTTALFVVLIWCDVLLWQTRPCDLFNLLDTGTLCGELLLLAGLLLRSWAAGTIHKAKELTTVGPYQFVRNPLYIGSFCMMFGFSLLLRDWIALWVVMGPLLAMYLNKVRQEELHLARHFPDAWQAYAGATPRFVPQQWHWPSLAGFSLRRWIHNQEYRAVSASLLGLVALWYWHRVSA